MGRSITELEAKLEVVTKQQDPHLSWGLAGSSLPHLEVPPPCTEPGSLPSPSSQVVTASLSLFLFLAKLFLVVFLILLLQHSLSQDIPCPSISRITTERILCLFT